MPRLWWTLTLAATLGLPLFSVTAGTATKTRKKPVATSEANTARKQVNSGKPDLAHSAKPSPATSRREAAPSQSVAAARTYLPRTGIMPPVDSPPPDADSDNDFTPELEQEIERLLAQEIPVSPEDLREEHNHPLPATAPAIPARNKTRSPSQIEQVSAEEPADEPVPAGVNPHRYVRKLAAPSAASRARAPARFQEAPPAEITSTVRRAARPLSPTTDRHHAPSRQQSPLAGEAAPRDAQHVPLHEQTPAPGVPGEYTPVAKIVKDSRISPADYVAPPSPVSEIELVGGESQLREPARMPTAYSKGPQKIAGLPQPTHHSARHIRPVEHRAFAPPVSRREELPRLGPDNDSENDLQDVNPPPPPRNRIRPKASFVRQTALTPAMEEGSPALVQAIGQLPQTPTITLRWMTDGEVTVGQQCRCGLVVRNESNIDAREVIVEATFPNSVQILKCVPACSAQRDRLAWKIPLIPAGKEFTIQVAMIPQQKGELATSASVRFTGTASTVLKVEEPDLAVVLKGAQEVIAGETFTQIVHVSNPGTGTAQDIVVHAEIPSGLEHPRGKRIELAIGTLTAGETREIRLSLTAVAGGEQTLAVEARCGKSLVRQTQTTIQVSAPQLQVNINGPALRYVDRQAQYVTTVKNAGGVPTDNVRVQYHLPVGFEFVKAERGGRHDWSTRTVTWFLGRLEAEQTVELPAVFMAKQSGAQRHSVIVTDEVGGSTEATLETRIDAISAVVMEVVDLDDPVEVGVQTGYEIRIRNDGTREAQNIQVQFDLPREIDLVDTQGPTPARRGKTGIMFRPIESLGPKQRATYRVIVSGQQAGNLRVRARLTQQGGTDPMVVEEQTKFYAD